ncbi:MAG: hypothetical protein GWM90_03775 [Gemmatimonadetes bacterium]|nr:hypothetical protein [Gemmatimonadota bacterium]NIQ52778.1 hypothetical protein [Gemmatimonadota bacterium]NIU72908.1 hypothetical protein [Gammaproteobacteria bacterium]NIX43268.1 hypothetical protein [Gemmatimonadota bacterium]NIY07445.1 hypothetical protein [Gemmatimonadota bacterium]
MRRVIFLISATLLALPLPACDWGLGTEPDSLRLEDLPDPPRNHATLAITETLFDGLDRPMMTASTQYFFPLRTPPPLPELLFDAAIAGGAPAVKVVLSDATLTGTFDTSDPDVSLLFAAPDGAVFEPVGSCRITVASALDLAGAGRLQASFDCPMTDGNRDLRVLVKLDHTPE